MKRRKKKIIIKITITNDQQKNRHSLTHAHHIQQKPFSFMSIVFCIACSEQSKRIVFILFAHLFIISLLSIASFFSKRK